MKLQNIKQLKKLFKEDKDKKNTLLKPEEIKGFMDATSVFMVIPKTKEMQTALREGFDCKEQETIKIDYTNSQKGKFSIEYLIKILEFLKLEDNTTSVKIEVKEGYPITFETNEYSIILAPRCED